MRQYDVRRGVKIGAFLTLAPALLVVSGGLLLRPVLAQEAKEKADDTTYTIPKREYKAKETDRYKITANTSTNLGGSAVEIKVALLMKETVTEVKNDGSLKLLNEFEQATANVMGVDQDLVALMLMPKVILMRDKSGNVEVKTEGGDATVSDQVSSMVKGLATLQVAFYPSKPVKVGDTYQISYKGVVAPGQEGEIKGDAKVAAVETISGIKTLKITMTSDIKAKTPGADANKTEVACNLDVKTGKIVRMTSKADGTANGTKLSVDVNLRLVTPNDKEDKAPTEKK